MPELVQLHSDLKDDADAAFILIDTNDEEAEFRALIEKEKMTAPHIFDPEGKIAEGYDLKGFPTTFVVDENGKILAANYFEADFREMVRDFKVRKKAAEKKDAPSKGGPGAKPEGGGEKVDPHDDKARQWDAGPEGSR